VEEPVAEVAAEEPVVEDAEAVVALSQIRNMGKNQNKHNMKMAQGHAMARHQ